MYASDYGFAASQKYWSLAFYSESKNDLRENINENWLYR